MCYENDVVTAAIANANLAPSQELDKITGVNTDDDDPRYVHIISDGKESDEDDDEEDGYGFGSKDPDVALGNNQYGILAENDEDTEHEHALIQGGEDNRLGHNSNNDEHNSPNRGRKSR